MNKVDTIQAAMNALDRRAAYSEKHQGLSMSDDIQIAIARFLGEIATQLVELNQRLELDGQRIASALEGLERK